MVRAWIANDAANFLAIGTDKDECWRINDPQKTLCRCGADVEAGQGSAAAFCRCGVGSADLFMPQITIPAAVALDHNELQVRSMSVSSHSGCKNGQNRQHGRNQQNCPCPLTPGGYVAHWRSWN